MERDLKVIIEFNGLPGTGKTTVCNRLGEGIKGRKSVLFRLSPPSSAIKRYICNLTDGSSRLRKLATVFADSLGDQGAEDRKAHIESLIKYYRMYLRFQKSYDGNSVLLIDQGIIQSLISIAYDSPIKPCRELDDIFVYLKSKEISFQTVDCLADTELSCQRIADRGGAGGRLDEISDKKRLIEILEIQKNNFSIVRSAAISVIGCSSIQIDTKLPIDQNADMIAKNLLRC